MYAKLGETFQRGVKYLHSLKNVSLQNGYWLQTEKSLLYSEVAPTPLAGKLKSPVKDRWISCASRYNTPRKYNVLW